MASVASQLMDKVTAHAQSDSLEDARDICADGTYFPNNLRIGEQVSPGLYCITLKKIFGKKELIFIRYPNGIRKDFNKLSFKI